MSYRPDSQSIREPLNKILEGISEFDQAVQERLKSGEFIPQHEVEISELDNRLHRLKHTMLKLVRDNW